MITEVISEEINSKEEKERIPYLLENVFQSKFILGRINVIKKGANGKFMFVDLIVSSDLSMKYKLDNREWEIYGNINEVSEDIKESLKRGDLIYFQPSLNRINPEQIIQINGQTVKKLISYKEFLEEINIDIQNIRLEGNVALEKEEEVRVWATQQFYNNFKSLHEDLLKELEEAKAELDNTRKKEKEIYEAIESREKELKEQEKQMEDLGRKLEYFGFKSFQKQIVKNEFNVESLGGSSLDIFYYIKNYLRNNKQLIYSDDH